MTEKYEGGYAYQEAPKENKTQGTGTARPREQNQERKNTQTQGDSQQQTRTQAQGSQKGNVRRENINGNASWGNNANNRAGSNAKSDDYYYHDFKNDYYDGYVPKGFLDLRKAVDIPLPLIIGSYFFAPFIGILLTIARVIGSAQVKEVDAMIKNRNHQNSQYGRTTHYTSVSTGKGSFIYSTNSNTSSQSEAKTQAEQYYYGGQTVKSGSSQKGTSKNGTYQDNNDKKRNRRSNVVLALGILFVIGGLTSLSDSIGWIVDYGMTSYYLSDLLTNIWLIAGGGILSFIATRMKRTNRFIRKIKAIVGKKDNMPIDDIAQALPATNEATLKILQKCIDKDEFGPLAYLDMRTDHLVIRGEAPESEFGSESDVNSKKTDDEFEESEYQKVLRRLKELNDAIPGEEMTSKISRIEKATAQIFAIVEKEPSKKSQIKKFMSYYLPTAQKILELYANYEEHEVDGEISQKTKQSIEASMDDLVQGFEKQLDKLYSHEAMDIKADIKVLNNMLKQDGLIDKDELIL